MNGYTRISYEERVKIELLLSQGKKRSEIALTLNRPRSTINREIERNSGLIYRSELAQLEFKYLMQLYSKKLHYEWIHKN